MLQNDERSNEYASIVRSIVAASADPSLIRGDRDPFLSILRVLLFKVEMENIVVVNDTLNNKKQCCCECEERMEIKEQ